MTEYNINIKLDKNTVTWAVSIAFVVVLMTAIFIYPMLFIWIFVGAMAVGLAFALKDFFAQFLPDDWFEG